MNYFPPYNHDQNKINIEVDLSNHATKSDIKNEQVLIHNNLLKKMISLT